MGILNFIISNFQKENSEFNTNKDNLIISESLNNSKENKNFLNKKTSRKDNNLDDNEIQKNKKVKNTNEYKNNDQQNWMLEQVYNLTKENNKLLKNLTNNQIQLKNNSINDEYSYKVVDPDLRGIMNLQKGMKNIELFLILKNDGDKYWPEGLTKLIIDKKSTSFKTNQNEIILGYLEVGEEKRFKIEIDFLENLEVKKYQLVFDFYVGNKKYGNKIYINFQVIEDKIDEFRARYEIDNNIASDSTIARDLKKYNDDFPKAYNSILNILGSIISPLMQTLSKTIYFPI